MRINVYAEELTTEVKKVTKVVDGGTENERIFYGVRFFLVSPSELHHTSDDDDRSAITIWVPWTRREGHDIQSVRDLFAEMMMCVDDIEVEANA